ncbi:1,3-beta-glucan synthase subunit FKS1-like protein [Tanacetum coccineum]
MSKARKKAEKPKFMNQVTWEALCRVWILPTFIAKSKRGKTARQSNKRLHTGGSIPINEHKTKLREELSREPSVSELFLRCHQNKKTKVFVEATAKATWDIRNAVHGADDALDAQCGNGAKTFPKWIDHVGSKNGTAYGVRDVDEYVEHNLMKTEINNLKNANEAQSKKLDQVVKAQSSSEKRLRKFVAQEVGKVVANEVGKVVAEEVGKATQQILDAIRIRPEAQSNKLDLVVKAQSSSEKRLRKYVAKEVGKVVANEAKKAVVEEVGKATQKILEAIRIRPV